MLERLGGGEIILVLVILIILFGSKKITELARGAGEATRELKKVKEEFEKAANDVVDRKGGDSHTT